MSELGSEILEDVAKMPRKYRMGDIFYKVQEKIEKKFGPVEREFARDEQARKESFAAFKARLRAEGEQKESRGSSSSAKRRDDELFEYAEQLKGIIAEDPGRAIDGALLFGKHLTYF